MKKILIQFAALALVLCAIFMVSGKTDGWIEPPEEAATSDIMLSGTKFNGKVVVTITLHPDGTGEHEGNGEKSDCTWETGTGDVAMTVHLTIKGVNYDMDVRDDGTQYVADYPAVSDFQLTGAKPVKDIVLSGTKYNGKVVVTITLHPDGTGIHEGNGEKSDCTWEPGTGDAAMIVHLTIKDVNYDMAVRDNGAQYVADYPAVSDFQLTGSKNGAAAAVQQEQPETNETAEAPAAASNKDVSAETKSDEPEYAPNTYVLTYTADVNDQLKGNFHVESDVWESALGTSGSYAPSDSKEVLFSWTGSGKSKELDFLADGTYEFRFATMSIAEHGTWTFDEGKITLNSEGGNTMNAELIQ